MIKTYYHSPKRVAKARELRRQQTESEKILWNRLRNKKLGGYKFRRQHIIQDYIVDFYCAEKRLIIELDGDYHNEQFQKIKDLKREQELKDSGYIVLRFKNEEILDSLEKALESIKKNIEENPSSPMRALYSPLPRNEV